MNKATGTLSIIRRLVIVIAIAIVFVFGLATTVFLSLRSPEVKVPDVLGKDRFEAERVLGDAGLNFRVRAYRPAGQMKADMVLFQLPKGGEVVKAGQTVAMDLSRPVKEGESSDVTAPEKSPEEKPANTNASSSGNENENKPKRPKSTNKNANENANANTGNRNGNINRATTTNRNSNSGNTNGGTNTNSNRPAINSNSNRAVNQNGNARPAVARPSPTVRPN